MKFTENIWKLVIFGGTSIRHAVLTLKGIYLGPICKIRLLSQLEIFQIQRMYCWCEKSLKRVISISQLWQRECHPRSVRKQIIYQQTNNLYFQKFLLDMRAARCSTARGVEITLRSNHFDLRCRPYMLDS